MSTQPPLCLRDLGQHFHKPNPANHISLFPEGYRLLQDHHSFRILALPWLSFSFILSLLGFFFFELFLKVKVLCYSHSKGQPLDGGCICYRNICIAWQQYNKTFQDAVLVFLFSPASRSWKELS